MFCKSTTGTEEGNVKSSYAIPRGAGPAVELNAPKGKRKPKKFPPKPKTMVGQVIDKMSGGQSW